MVSPRILTVFVMALGFVLGVAELTVAQESLRISWVHDKGNVTNTKGPFWKETYKHADKDDVYFFVEVHRNQDFIEAYDASRDLHIRLYKTKMILKVKDGDWGCNLSVP